MVTCFWHVGLLWPVGEHFKGVYKNVGAFDDESRREPRLVDGSSEWGAITMSLRNAFSRVG